MDISSHNLTRSRLSIVLTGTYESLLLHVFDMTEILQAWFYGEGTSLPVEPEYDTTLAQEAYDLAARWDASRTKTVSELEFKESDLKTFNSNQIGTYISLLPLMLP